MKELVWEQLEPTLLDHICYDLRICKWEELVSACLL